MFDFVARHKRLIQIVLALIAIPFAFFGVDTYFRAIDPPQAVARIGGYWGDLITVQEFTRALRERQDALRRALGGELDPALLDSPELRYATLEGIIQRRLLLEQALRAGMTVSDERLRAMVTELPLFRDESGRFSPARYQEFLRIEGMTPAIFEARTRQEALVQRLTQGYAGTHFVPRTVVERVARLMEQEREVSVHRIAAEKFLATVRLAPDAARRHYEAHPAEYETPEQVRVDYVMLSQEALARRARVDPAELRAAYEGRRAQFGQNESRRAAHILITFDPAGGAEAKKQARARAEQIRAQVARDPARFAEIARRSSQDPGSAAQGGDLGWIVRGAMKDAPEFEQALFALAPGAVSEPVETRHGFHIIRLVEVRAARVRPFEEVARELEEELRKQHAAKRFAELAEQFANVVFEQSDSLKPAAELVGGEIEHSGWITRQRAEPALLANPKLLAAIFSEEAIKGGRNTEAVEVARGTIVAARVVEHRPARLRPFEEVRAEIEKKLAREEAQRLAVEEGQALLERLRRGDAVSLAWSAPQRLTRSEHKGLPTALVEQAFRAGTRTLPAYTGAPHPDGGYALLRIGSVREPRDIPEERRQALAESLRQLQGQEQLGAALASLKQKASVKISRERLEKAER